MTSTGYTLERQYEATMPARVSICDGSLRRIGVLNTATQVNRSYGIDNRDTASVQIALDDVHIGDTNPLDGRVLLIESNHYPVPWVGKVTKRRGTHETVMLEARAFDGIFDHRVLPTAYETTRTAGEEFRRLVQTVNEINATGIEVGRVENHVRIAGLAFPDWTARRALDALAEQSGMEWWVEYDVSAGGVITATFRVERERGFDRYRAGDRVTLVADSNGNAEWSQWSEDAEAAAFSLTVVAGQTSVTESFTQRSRAVVVTEQGGGFVPTIGPTVSGPTQTVNPDGSGSATQASSYATFGAAPTSPVTRSQRVVVQEELKNQDVTVQSAQALISRRRFSEKVITCTAVDTDTWASLRVGDFIRLLAPEAFIDGFDGPARVLGVQPLEEVGLMRLVLELRQKPLE